MRVRADAGAAAAAAAAAARTSPSFLSASSFVSISSLLRFAASAFCRAATAAPISADIAPSRPSAATFVSVACHTARRVGVKKREVAARPAGRQAPPRARHRVDSLLEDDSDERAER